MSKARLPESMMEWKNIPWRKLDRRVFKLQKRIFKASQRGDVKAVRRLQKTLMRSWSAKCIAVRRVSQDNQETFPKILKSLPSLALRDVCHLVIPSQPQPKNRRPLIVAVSNS